MEKLIENRTVILLLNVTLCITTMHSKAIGVLKHKLNASHADWQRADWALRELAGAPSSLANHCAVMLSMLRQRILRTDMIGTDRNAPGRPHIMYQKTRANSTTTGWRFKRFPKTCNHPSESPSSERRDIGRRSRKPKSAHHRLHEVCDNQLDHVRHDEPEDFLPRFHPIIHTASEIRVEVSTVEVLPAGVTIRVVGH